jgi:hypothetical protein
MKGLRNSGPVDTVRTLIKANNPEITDTIEGGEKSRGKLRKSSPYHGVGEQMSFFG